MAYGMDFTRALSRKTSVSVKETTPAWRKVAEQENIQQQGA